MRLRSTAVRVRSVLTRLADQVSSPEQVPLWPEGAPGAHARRHEPEVAKDWWVANIHHPSLTVFRPRPQRATGAAIIVLPGGGHRQLVFGPEGVDPARFLAGHGLTAFVLKYRLACEPGSPYGLEDARADTLRAVRWVRSHAQRFRIDAERVGVMGWSAGGELAAMVSYGDSAGSPDAPDPVDRASGRPNFLVAIYPVRGIPTELPSEAPDAFFLAASDDTAAADTVSRLAELYRGAERSVELHLFARGGHGFNMGQRSDLRAIRTWPKRLSDWLETKQLGRRPRIL